MTCASVSGARKLPRARLRKRAVATGIREKGTNVLMNARPPNARAVCVSLCVDSVEHALRVCTRALLRVHCDLGALYSHEIAEYV
jgi:hypothetical protein